MGGFGRSSQVGGGLGLREGAWSSRLRVSLGFGINPNPNSGQQAKHLGLHMQDW